MGQPEDPTTEMDGEMGEDDVEELTPIELIKEFVNQSTTNKAGQRLSWFRRLEILISEKNEVINDKIAVGLAMTLIGTLQRYVDRPSRLAVRRLIAGLAQSYPEAILGKVALALEKLAQSLADIPHIGAQGTSLDALGWVCAVIIHAFPQLKDNTAALSSLVKAQALLLDVLGNGRPHVRNSALSTVRAVFAKVPDLLPMYLPILLKGEQAGWQAPSLGTYVRYCVHTSKQELISTHKAALLDNYTKALQAAKTPFSPAQLDGYGALVEQMTADEFKASVIPIDERITLRSINVAVDVVSAQMRHAKFDVSPFVPSLQKTVLSCLQNKEDDMRVKATTLAGELAKAIESPPAVAALAKAHLDLLNGKTGKVTIWEHRASVLASLAEVGAVPRARPVAVDIVNDLVAYAKKEANESALLKVIETIGKWSVHLDTFPAPLAEAVAAGLKLDAKAPVRRAYLGILATYLPADAVCKATALVKPLAALVLRGEKTQAQIANVVEGMVAAAVLIKWATLDTQVDAQVRSESEVQGVVFDKELFASERFFGTCTVDDFTVLADLAATLLAHHTDRIINKSSQWQTIILQLAVHSDWRVRRAAFDRLRPALLAHGSVHTTTTMLAAMASRVLKDDAPERSPVVLAHVAALLCTVPPTTSSDAKSTVAFEALHPFHHPKIASKKAYAQLLHGLGMDMDEFLATQCDAIVAHVTGKKGMASQHMNDQQTALSIITTGLQAVPDTMLAPFFDYALEQFDSKLAHEVKEYEYGVYRTPEGSLYDDSLLANIKKQDAMIHNRKRTSKLYSMEDEKWEMEMRREMAKKQGKDPDQPKLTKHQQEALEKQLAKESLVRQRVLVVDTQLSRAINVFKTILHTNPTGIQECVPSLLEALLPMLNAPLVSRRAMDLWCDVASTLTPPRFVRLALPLAFATFRVDPPYDEINPAWLEENMKTLLSRVIERLDAMVATAILPPASFAYAFRLLELILLRQQFTQITEQKHSLAIIRKHLGQLGQEGGYPRREALALLSHVVACYDNLQAQAASALVQLCTSSGLLNQSETEVLLNAYLSSTPALRKAVIESLAELDLEPTPEVLTTCWLACYDEDDTNSALASELWDDKEFELVPEQCLLLAAVAETPLPTIQGAVARALSAALAVHSGQTNIVVQRLLTRHDELHQLPPQKFDEYGRPIVEKFVDPWEKRLGIATALKGIAPNITSNELMLVMDAFINCGFADRNAKVRDEMLAAALNVIENHGKENVSILLNIFENYMDTPAPASEVHDHIRESVIICVGSLAKHLAPTDPKIPPTINKLVAALKTPSQQVQEAVAKCLPPLIQAIKADAGGLCEQLMKQLLEGAKFSERKGAAYGLAGVVKGLGILSLKQHNIITTLTTAIQNTKDTKHREGALMAFETLVVTLGRLFEPYVIKILPDLLLCFGDGNKDVREAADDTAKAIVRHLSESRASGPGVKLVLPHLLNALDDKQWRTKQGAVEMLGAMSFCAPDQLSSCLPQIVPRLSEVLTDSHPKVQGAARKALTQIGSVIKNPEIQAIVDVLLDALADPNHKTQKCLTTLLDTNFVHFIDAPSLALIMPALQRALKERETETKMMAAQIIGNMSALTNQKDLAPYLVHILPGLKKVLVDPNPAVREISAKALGTMVRGMGEENFADLIPWLIDTLKTDNSAVDRSGAAQGLSEVLYGLGVERLEGIIPDIIANTNTRQAHVREGFLMVFVFLPASFGEELKPFIPQLLLPILRGLADESESVRDAALKAGQMIVNNYSDTSVEIFLPELEKGLFDDNWRIRQSSVHLLGDLLFRISGQSGKKSTNSAHDDDNFGTEESRRAIMEILGEERSHRVFAGLYMARSDVSLLVRQAALHIWKVVVFNTARTVREVMPVLMELLLSCLASHSFDKRQIAARTLGDVVKKLGDRILPEIIPILEQGLDSDDPNRRCGVCVGLSEIMGCAGREQVLYYINSLIPSVRTALCDPLPQVREAAAQTFNTLHTAVGYKAIDEILPALLEAMDDPSQADGALDGLRQIMAVKSTVVLPFLIPKLTASPVTAKNVHALAALAGVSGPSLNRHISTILPPLVAAINLGEDDAEAIKESLEDILLAIDNEAGVSIVIQELLSFMSSDSNATRATSANLLAAFCDRTEEDFTEHIPTLLQKVLHMFNDEDEECVKAGWNAAQAICKAIKKEDQAQYISLVRRTFRLAARDHLGRPIEELPGFCLPKGISPILPMFLHGLIYGTPETREIAAAGLGDIIALTSANALKPFVIQITGPLIRVIADRFAWQVKAAILRTLDVLIRKVGQQLKAFLPQLQTTFIKALSDPTKVVRDRAALALGQLAAIHTRIDPLLTDLCNGVRTGEDPVRESMLLAMLGVLPEAVGKVADKTKELLEETLTDAMVDSLPTIRERASRCVGLLGRMLEDSACSDLVSGSILVDDGARGDVMQGRMAALAALLAPGNAPEKVYPTDTRGAIVPFIIKGIRNEDDAVCSLAVSAACHLVTYLGAVEGHTPESIPQDLLPAVANALASRGNDVKVAAAQALKHAAKGAPELMGTKQVLSIVVGPLLAIVRGTHTPGKIASERALIYVLQLKKGDTLLLSFAKTLDAQSSTSLIDLGKRVLPRKFEEESDDEDRSSEMIMDDSLDME
eukprot:comp24257_c0_seq1/m.44983 comp24257_c0_seq1/g.44983  ORF comp24257_c0_seq1/g.44983 comp24257_c0_seq1/m.44983 type:complete len:2647 (-) comp24257_c0_seq1:496-8436(-)